eukprot:CAMPEP_0171569796 /NCGR_PEP_ID=MMETSP0961-20121227/2567_1 /TAXON_ID=87120 /ORGANISM="Aurantiochytrium limacinum, Strain ATCCMYA-1381" /LENGTH=57 /DNA_ID=CAMNT_0012124173 /DNA_START=1074 /DNA_END=1243 /DNA_ORIENTATION=+
MAASTDSSKLAAILAAYEMSEKLNQSMKSKSAPAAANLQKARASAWGREACDGREEL